MGRFILIVSALVIVIAMLFVGMDVLNPNHRP